MLVQDVWEKEKTLKRRGQMNIIEGNTVAHTFSLRFRNRIVRPEAEGTVFREE